MLSCAGYLCGLVSAVASEREVRLDHCSAHISMIEWSSETV